MSAEHAARVGAAASGHLSSEWRAAAAESQARALPAGRVLVSCPAPYGAGGLGRHLEEIVEALRRGGASPSVISDPRGAAPAELAVPVANRRDATRLLAPLLRFSPPWRMWAASRRFDRRAANSLSRAEHLIAFNGTAVEQFHAARAKSYESVALMSANSHFERVVRQHDRAYRQYPIERPWAEHLLSRNLAEYAAADRIYVSSGYVRDSFLERGFAADRLASFPLTPAPRYFGAERAPRSESFEIVYVGSLVVHKGVPLLIEAFGRLADRDLRLVLVGGWKTRSMSRYIEAACAGDRRISVAPGDPLMHLRRASLCVHGAYEDGFAYAPAEALASGVPVIVSEDTGMKELIGSEAEGLVVPTGDLDALTSAIAAAARGEIFGGGR